MIPQTFTQLKHKILTSWYYHKYDDHEAYSRVLDLRINDYGPEATVGGFDTGVGKLQFEFLKERGLTPADRFLDLGCGPLRGGEYFIRFLNSGNYIGIDMSEELIQSGKERLGEEFLAANQPIFIVNGDLTFAEVDGRVDKGIAQSVFTHLPMERIRTCLAHLPHVLADNGVFYATFFDEPQSRPQDFGYEPEQLLSAAEKAGLEARMLPAAAYHHPHDQRMLELTRR